MKTIIRVSVAALMLYGLLYWVVNNPKSVASIKTSIDETARDFADSLTDE